MSAACQSVFGARAVAATHSRGTLHARESQTQGSRVAVISNPHLPGVCAARALRARGGRAASLARAPVMLGGHVDSVAELRVSKSGEHSPKAPHTFWPRTGG